MNGPPGSRTPRPHTGAFAALSSMLHGQGGDGEDPGSQTRSFARWFNGLPHRNKLLMMLGRADEALEEVPAEYLFELADWLIS